jgi:hypothetical protein
MLGSVSGCSSPSTVPLSPRVLVDASLPPARTCPDLSALLPGRSCSSLWMLSLYPASAPNKQAFWACFGKAWYQAEGALGPGRPGGARPMPRTV